MHLDGIVGKAQINYSGIGTSDWTLDQSTLFLMAHDGCTVMDKTWRRKKVYLHNTTLPNEITS